MSVKFERLDAANAALPLTNEQLQAIEKDLLSAPLKQSGSYGYVSWDVDFHLDITDITKSYAYLKVAVCGINIVDGRLDINNPKFTIDATVVGVGVNTEVGIDFNKRLVYFKGYLNFIFYRYTYDFTIFSF